MFFVHLLIYEILFYLYNKNKEMIEVYKNLYGYDIINIDISIYRTKKGIKQKILCLFKVKYF